MSDSREEALHMLGGCGMKKLAGEKQPKQWTKEDREFATKGRGLNAIRLVDHVTKLQALSGRSRRDCRALIDQQVFGGLRRGWTSEEIEEARELLTIRSISEVAKKLGRSRDALKGLCRREGISVRGLRCDMLSVPTLANLLNVRRSEINSWIDNGWLEISKTDAAKNQTRVSPEALEKCLRVHRINLQKRNVRSATILRVFEEFCYVPKHAEGKQLLDMREGMRLRDHEEFSASL